MAKHEAVRRLAFGAAILAIGLAAPVAARAQDARGTVIGTVTDQATGQPLAGVQVVASGTGIGLLTNEQGQYRLEGVPAGTRSIEAVTLGYASASQSVTVPAGGTVTADFQLATAAVSLNEVVVTVTGQQRKKELANSVTELKAPAIVQSSPITTVSELLNTRAAGVNVLQSSGSVGVGSRIRIRGSNSVSLDNDPIVYVDGARVYSAARTLSITTGGQETGRTVDIDPEDIETIEVIKGPSAAALYGTDAANGVIRITTKHGRPGAPRWTAYAEGGVLDKTVDFPLNYGGKAGTTVDADDCYAFQAAAGECTQQTILTYQPLNDPVVTPFRTGSHQQYGASVSGGGSAVDYFFSGDYLSELGVLGVPDSALQAIRAAGQTPFDWQTRPNDFRRLSLRGNVGAEVAKGLTLTVSSSFVSGRTHLPQNDNQALGIVPSGLLGNYSPELGQHGYGFLTPQEVFAIEALQEVNRFTGSAQTSWQPASLPWLSARGTLGLDLTDRHDSDFVPVGAITEFGEITASGERDSNRLLNQAWSADVSGTASFRLPHSMTSRTTAGMQYFRNLLRGTLAGGEGLTPGTKSLAGSAKQTAAEQTAESITLGFFGEEQLGWRDRVFLSAALRADDNSAFGSDFTFAYYPKLGVSYVLLDQGDAAPRFGALSSVRLRAAWGASGVAPGPTDALRFYNASTVSVLHADRPGVSFGGVGNLNLKPERSREIEAGFDATLFRGRGNLSFSYYDKRTHDALIQRTLAPSLGVSLTRFENIGSVLNRGVELQADAVVLDRRPLKLEFTVAGSHNHNELLALGPGIAPIISDKQRFVPGFALGGYWDNPITFQDANGDGVITPDEITRGDTAVFLGNVFPSTQIGLTGTATFLQHLRVSAVLDRRSGFSNYNLTEVFRCRFAICRGLNDPTAPLAEQAAAVETIALGADRSAAPFIQDASFWKLREVSFTFLPPAAWTRFLNGRTWNLVVTGRNLKTWTKYSGLDPENNEYGQANFFQDEFLTQPPIRAWNVRLNVSF